MHSQEIPQKDIWGHKGQRLREITDMALPVTTAAKSISIKHHHVALGVDMRAQITRYLRGLQQVIFLVLNQISL